MLADIITHSSIIMAMFGQWHWPASLILRLHSPLTRGTASDVCGAAGAEHPGFSEALLQGTDSYFHH